MIRVQIPVEQLERVWRSIAARFAAYELVVPGSATFECQAELCDAYCCRAYSVNLGESEVGRMATASGLSPSRFLETEDGELIALPMAQPYLLRREENRCSLLGESLGCTQYHGRPNACRLYPHFVVFIDVAAGRPVYADDEVIRKSVSAFRDGGPVDGVVPLLLRHVECPGFTGEPMGDAAWWQLFDQTFALQYPAEEV